MSGKVMSTDAKSAGDKPADPKFYWIDKTATLLLTTFQRVGSWAKRYRVLIFCALGLAALYPLLWPYVRPFFYKVVVIHTGEPNTTSDRLGRQIQDKLNAHRRMFDYPFYEVQIRQTTGLHQNRQLVARPENASGDTIMLGFDQDGFTPPDEVRTLVQLDRVTLHLITRADLAQNIRGHSPVSQKSAVAALGSTKRNPGLDTTPLAITELVRWPQRPSHWPLRLYLGARGSGTRQIAEKVLANLGIDPKEVDVGDHYSQSAAYWLLRHGQCDLVFDASDKGGQLISDEVRRARKENRRLTLVSIPHREGLKDASENSLVEDEIKPGTYAAADAEFNPCEIKTVATQRIIICPAALPDRDAFLLSARIQAALGRPSDQPAARENRVISGRPLACPMHPGAIAPQDTPSLFGWLWRTATTPLGFLLLGLLFYLVTEIFRRKDADASQRATPVIRLAKRRIDFSAGRAGSVLIPFTVIDLPESEKRVVRFFAGSTNKTVVPLEGLRLCPNDSAPDSIRIAPSGVSGMADVYVCFRRPSNELVKSMIRVTVAQSALPVQADPEAGKPAATTELPPASSEIVPDPAAARTPRPLPESLQKLLDDCRSFEVQLDGAGPDAGKKAKRKLRDQLTELIRRSGELRQALGAEYRDDFLLVFTYLGRLQTDLEHPMMMQTPAGEATSVVPQSVK